MRLTLLAGLLTAILAPPAQAGPWAKEPRAVFLSFSTEISMDPGILPLSPEYGVAAYGELGLGRRFTVIADLFAGADRQTGLLFLQRTLTRPDAVHQFAVRLGVGATFDDMAEVEGMGAIGASWGKGFDSRWGTGWMTLDAQIRQGMTAMRQTKIDATIGLRPIPDWSAILQLQVSQSSGSDPALRLQATAVRRFGDRFSLEAGITYGLMNDPKAGVKLGLWTDF